jgi:GntP family gluconate:H+ symporter
MMESGALSSSRVVDVLASLGDKNIALGIGVVFALMLKKYCPDSKRSSVVSRSLAAGGNIILITAAGGAFGAMLRQAGIEQAVGALTQGVPGIMILPLAFVVTASIRTLQGSATVAMITAAGVLQGFAQPETLPFHPVYLAMAIGAGSKPVSWMTDSAFWVITRMSGMTEAEGLRVVSPMSICLGFSALLFTMLFAVFFPFA